MTSGPSTTGAPCALVGDHYCPTGASDGPPEASLNLSKVTVLVVGAGGIGCELVKTLVMSGFMRIGVIDLDTIDITNLNRQFFFRKEHVGLSKAKVLADACSKLFSPRQRQQIQEAAAAGGGGAAKTAAKEGKLIPGSRVYGVVGMHGNILSAEFSVSFISSFDLVFAALDNLQARRHLNRLCLAAAKPLIEAGSTGYSGQVVPIVSKETLCFDCEAKPVIKDRFPVCTLRQQPEKPEHCVAWGKMLYELLFGLDNPNNMLADLKTDLERILASNSDRNNSTSSSINGTSNGTSNGGASSKSSKSEDIYNAGIRIMEEVFSKQINDLLQLKADWKGKAPPVPLQIQPELRQVPHQQRHPQVLPHSIWSPLECQQVFISSFCSLMERKLRMQQQQPQQRQEQPVQQQQLQGIPFDKDDEPAMDFVAASAIIRMVTFHIPAKVLQAYSMDVFELLKEA